MRSSLIWVCTVCSDLSVPIFKIITVMLKLAISGKDGIIGVIHSTLVISTSIISNNRLSRRENLILVLTQKSQIRNKILWIRGKIAPKEQFLPFSTKFSIYISNLKRQITYLFVKFGCSICIFLNSAKLICRSTDISKCFRGSLRLRDNKS